VFIIDRINVKDGHFHAFLLQVSALIVQTEEPLGQQAQEFVEQTHADDGVAAMAKEVVLELRVFDLVFDFF